MKNVYLAALAVGLLTPQVAVAAGTQVNPDTYRCSGNLFGDSTDGTCFRKSQKTPELVVNGTPSVDKDSPAWYVSFEGLEDGEDLQVLQADGTAHDATALSVNHAYVTGGGKFAYTALVAETIAPDMDAGSLDFGGDQTADDGYEVWAGTVGSMGRPFVVGSDPAFQTCLKFAVEDVSGTDDFHFGFRRAETANATFDNYLDLATVGFEAADGTIDLATILNNAATTVTDTTDTLADATTTTWCVKVSGTGVVTYTIDGSAPTATAAFTFDDGDPLVPFLHYLQDTALTGEVDLYTWETKYTR